jgi:tetratricopeptide (TPR) repeat protein
VERLAGVERLAEIGSMADADRVLERLGDSDPRVRMAAEASIWQIWNRSGDPEIDKLFAQGVQQMQAAALDDALTSFNEIVLRKPDFAEGWNKRATIYFLRGQYEKSLADCDEVFKRNSQHFGACRAPVRSTCSWAIRNVRSSSSVVPSRSTRTWTGQGR